MERVLEDQLLRCLKNVGYRKAERKALELYISSLERYMFVYLRCVNCVSRHALKSHVTLLDVLRFVDIDFFVFCEAERIVYEHEKQVEDVRFCSQLASNIEKYIHIYEFMPNFPPIHTFRQTTMKLNNRSSRSFDVKEKLEQSLRSEKNLLKLVKASGCFPPFVNFLYKFRE